MATLYSPLRTVNIICLWLLTCCMLSGCSAREQQAPAMQLPAQSTAMFNAYQIVAGDVLDIAYLFNNSATKSFTLNAGDRVAVHFPSTPKLNSEQYVRPDGVVTLAPVGDIKVLGLTPEQASQKITEKFTGVLRFPSANLVVLQARSRSEDLKAAVTSGTRGQNKRALVRPDGYISLPSIGEVKVAGRTIRSVRKEIIKRYRVNWPSVTVSVALEETKGAQIYVLGSVNRSGNFSITSPVILPQALSLAGGLNREAATGVAYIARLTGGSTYTVSKFTYGENFISKNGIIPTVGPNDVVFIPRSTLSRAAQIMTELSNIFLLRGWSFTFTYDTNKTEYDF